MYTEITTVEKAFEKQKDKIDINSLPDLSSLPDKFSRGMMALLKLQVIIDGVNNDDPKVPEWKADYNDNGQQKWFSWYVGGSADGSGAGFRFFVSDIGWAYSSAFGGARLALKDKERSEHMDRYISDLYKELYLILK